MKKFNKEQHEHLEKHTVMENHERGEFIGNIVKIIYDKENINLNGEEIIQKLFYEYKKHIYNIETGSKKYARKYLTNVFVNDEYFDFNTLALDGFMHDYKNDLEKEEIGSSKGLSYGTFDKEIALENLRKYAKEKNIDLGL